MTSRILVFVAVLFTPSKSCGKPVDLDVARVIYGEWEEGWQVSKRCLFGTVDRSADPEVQVALHQLLDPPPGREDACPRWLWDSPNKAVKAAVDWRNDKERKADQNALTVWYQLEGKKIPQNVLDQVVELSNAIIALQNCGVEKCPDLGRVAGDIVKQRAKLRDMLQLPAEQASAASMKIVIEDVTLAPPPPAKHSDKLLPGEHDPLTTVEEPINASWKIAKHDGVFTLKSSSGASQALEFPIKDRQEGVPVRLAAIADDADPILWTDNVGKLGPRKEWAKYVRVFRVAGDKWTPTDVGPIHRIIQTPRRLDVLFEKKGQLLWTWFAPGNQNDRAELVVYGSADEVGWQCASDGALWTSRLGSEQIERWDPSTKAVTKKQLGVPSISGRPQCTSTKVAITARGGWYVCGEAPACDGPHAEEYGFTTVFANGSLVGVRSMGLGPTDKRPQLLQVRVLNGGAKPERILRLPSGALLETIDVRDGRVIGSVTTGRAKTEAVLF